jgi:hypothetical protein
MCLGRSPKNQMKLSAVLTTQLKKLSSPKKKMPSTDAISITMIVVITVSRLVGQVMRLRSTPTSLMNLPGLTFAKTLFPIHFKPKWQQPVSRFLLPRSA